MAPTSPGNDHPHVPPRQVLASAAALWLFYFVLVTLRGAVVELDGSGEMLWRRGLVTLAGIAVTLLTWPLLRAFDARRLPVRIGAAAVIMLPAALLLALINQQAFAPVEHRMIEKIAAEDAAQAKAARAEPPAHGTPPAPPEPPASPQTGITIRHDTAGNVLIDVAEPPLPPEPPAPPASRLSASVSGPVSAQQAANRAEAIKDALRSEGLWRQLTDVALGRYFLLIAWAALYLAMGNAERVRVAERREGELRRAAKAAELRSLRYQVNPHFLFNTLNSLSALVMTGRNVQAETMIQSISDFYRQSLAGDPTSDVALADEIALQRHYLAIEAVRFPDRLKVVVDVPEALGQIPVPGMILQPLIENAVKYAVAATARPVTITIAARRDGDLLHISVADDGPGAPADRAMLADPPSTGIGLANVRNRLAARFGDRAGLTAAPCGTGFRNELTIPLPATSLPTGPVRAGLS